MARFAYTDSSSPIHRGVFLARSVLGRSLMPPPEAVAPFDADLFPDMTTRQRVTEQTQPKACMACHGLINSLGFTMEHFDAVGRFRTEEYNKPIDATGGYELPSGNLRPLKGARDLALFLANRDETHRAFVIQLFHAMIKQPIMAYNEHAPDVLRRRFATQHQFNIRKLMVDIASFAALHEVDTTRSAAANESPGQSGLARSR